MQCLPDAAQFGQRHTVHLVVHGISHFAGTPAEQNAYALGFKSYGSGLGVWYTHSILHDPAVLNEHWPTLMFQWLRGPSDPKVAPYPEIERALFNHWGFGLTVIREPPRPKWVYVPQWWSVVMPIWFPIPFLLLLPWRWAHVRFVIPAHRRRQNHGRVQGLRLYRRDQLSAQSVRCEFHGGSPSAG